MGDETQVQNLQHSYGYYLDRKLWDDVADLFADDGSLEIAGHGVYVGKARIRRALEALYGPSPLRTGELFDHINSGHCRDRGSRRAYGRRAHQPAGSDWSQW